MKKFYYFLFFGLIFSFISCSNQVLVGNITTYNSDGSVLHKYNAVTIHENMFKSFGLNFTSDNKNYIISYSTPYVIDYNVNDVPLPLSNISKKEMVDYILFCNKEIEKIKNSNFLDEMQKKYYISKISKVRNFLCLKYETCPEE